MTSRRWRRLSSDAIAAGALGFSTSRTMLHKALDGEPVPGTFANEAELFGIGQAMSELGAGVFEISPSGVAGENDAAFPGELSVAQRRGRHRPTGGVRSTQSNGRPRCIASCSRGRGRGRRRHSIGAAGRRAGLGAAVRARHHVSPLRRAARRTRPRRAAGRREAGARCATPACAPRSSPSATSYSMRVDARTHRRPHLAPRRSRRLRATCRDQPRPHRRLEGCPPRRRRPLRLDGRRRRQQLFNVPMLNYAEQQLRALREMLAHPTSCSASPTAARTAPSSATPASPHR